MSTTTESEQKTSKLLKQILSVAVNRGPILSDFLAKVTLTPFLFGENLPKIMVVTMPLQLLINTKLQYSEIISGLKKEFPKYMILTRRSGDIPSEEVSRPLRAREDLVCDLLFPAKVAARTVEVESKHEKTQVVYLDNKNLCWSKFELASLEKLLTAFFKLNF